MKKIFLSFTVVVSAAALPPNSRAAAAARAPALIPGAAALGPVPVIQTPVMTPGLTAVVMPAPGPRTSTARVSPGSTR